MHAWRAVRVSGGRAPALTLLALAAAALSLGACSSGSTPTNPPAGRTTTTGRPSSGTTTTTTASTSSTAANSTRCVSSNLTGAIAGTQGGAGTFEVTIALKNTSTTPCTTGGYPGLQLVGASGTSLPTTTVRGGPLSFERITPVSLTVPAGGTVWFNVGYSDVPTGGESSCPVAASLQVIPPNDTTHLTVTGLHAAVCNHGTLDSSPLFGPGSPGTQTTAPPAG
jgi:hypothetical protein